MAGSIPNPLLRVCSSHNFNPSTFCDSTVVLYSNTEDRVLFSIDCNTGIYPSTFANTEIPGIEYA